MSFKKWTILSKLIFKKLKKSTSLEGSCFSDVEAIGVDEPNSVVLLPDLEIDATLSSLGSIEVVGASLVGKVLASTAVDFLGDDLSRGDPIFHVSLEVLFDPSTSWKEIPPY